MADLWGAEASPLTLGAMQWTLAVLFGVSAWSKLRHRAVFAATVADYQIVPAPLVSPVSTAMAFVEAVTALTLPWEATRVTAGAWAMALILLFSVAILVNLLRGRTHIDCGCFAGAFRQRIGWDLLARNGLLLLLAAGVWSAPTPIGTPDTLDWLAMAAMAAAAVLAFLAWGRWRR